MCKTQRSVYVCITVKGSRVCEHCNVLAVRKYVRATVLLCRVYQLVTKFFLFPRVGFCIFFCFRSQVKFISFDDCSERDNIVERSRTLN